MKNLLQNTRPIPTALIAMGALVIGIAGSSLLYSTPANAMHHMAQGAKTTFNAPDPNYPEIDIPPVFNAENQLIQPHFFREKWVFLGAPLTPNALNNGKAGFPEFHNVYTQPAAFAAYRKTGKWPVGTMLLKELQLIDDPKGEYPDSSRIMPSGRGFFPGPVNGIDIMVKDPKRFPESKNWGFFNFNHAPPPYKAASTEASIGECAGCHIANAQEDMVYIKTYLPILTPLPLPEGL